VESLLVRLMSDRSISGAIGFWCGRHDDPWGAARVIDSGCVSRPLVVWAITNHMRYQTLCAKPNRLHDGIG
jgi:hypothetical protein